MTTNGLDIKVTVEDFAKKSPDEKLTILYQVSLRQQKHCDKVSTVFNNRISKIETDKKLGKAKIVGIGIGSGVGGGGIIAWLKTFLGGN